MDYANHIHLYLNSKANQNFQMAKLIKRPKMFLINESKRFSAEIPSRTYNMFMAKCKVYLNDIMCF